MTKTSTKKSTKKVSPKVAEAVKETATDVKTEGSITRMVVEVPTESVQSFKVLCDLLGTTQGRLVEKALNKYLDDNKQVVDQFIALRTQIS